MVSSDCAPLGDKAQIACGLLLDILPPLQRLIVLFLSFMNTRLIVGLHATRCKSSKAQMQHLIPSNLILASNA